MPNHNGDRRLNIVRTIYRNIDALTGSKNETNLNVGLCSQCSFCNHSSERLDHIKLHVEAAAAAAIAAAILAL